MAFATRAQLPRLTTAIWLPPATMPAFAKASIEQPNDSSPEPSKPGWSVVVAGSSFSTTIGPLIGPVNVYPLALIALSDNGVQVGGIVLMSTPGVELHGSFAAVAIAPAAVPGEPATY